MAAERKKIVGAVTKETDDTVIHEAMTQLLADEHLKYYPQRSRFLTIISRDNPMKERFLSIMKIMKAMYMDLLVKYCKGKKFLELQNSWFFHVNLYFNDSFTVEGIDTKKEKSVVMLGEE